MKYTRISINLKKRLDNLQRHLNSSTNTTSLLREYNDILKEYNRTKQQFIRDGGSKNIPRVSHMDSSLNTSVTIDNNTLDRINKRIELKKIIKR